MGAYTICKCADTIAGVLVVFVVVDIAIVDVAIVDVAIVDVVIVVALVAGGVKDEMGRGH